MGVATTDEGRRIRFGRASVCRGGFSRLVVGAEVELEMKGEGGDELWARSVRIVRNPPSVVP